MANSATTKSEIQSVSISKRGVAASRNASDPIPALGGKPMYWLGADSPFGLVLPNAEPTSSTMYAPRGVWIDDQRLIVCDSGNHRVLIWSSIPDSDHSPADVVLGQPDFNTEGPAAAGQGPENGLHLPTGVMVVDGRLVVADAWHHRLLVWNRIPVESGTPPDYAIGQPYLSQVETNGGGSPSLNGMYWPYGIASIEGRLLVADTGNRRVLVWNEFPAEHCPADYVIGQKSAADSEENRGGSVAADSFRWPHDFARHKDCLFIADAGNHRVLCWNTMPEKDRPADMLIGQKDFLTAYELPYDAQGGRRLRFPYAITACEDVLAVADTANNRILFWRLPFGEGCNSPAYDVIGQFDLAGNGENRWESVNRTSLCWPYGICFNKGILAVADSGNNRVMIWDCCDIIEDRD